MTDDIVTRLKHQWTGEFDPTGELLCRAADEIERLRADRDKWFHLARRLYVQHDKKSSEVMELAHVLAIYEQALRND